MSPLYFVAFFVSMCAAARLDNTYLPPGSARTAGGSGSFLATPRVPARAGALSPVYGAPTGPGAFQAGTRSGPQVPILKYNSENIGDGTYRYEYETGNGIQAGESGTLKNAGTDYESSDVRGSFSYTGDDGQVYTITYTADENGFQPQGAHLPTPPPIPEAILRSLQLNAEEEARYPGGSDQFDGRAGPSQQYGAPRPQYGPPRAQGFSPSSGYKY